MVMTRHFIYVLAAVVSAAVCGALQSCDDDDSFTTSRSNLLTFSVDTVSMDTVFSRVPTSTQSFWVYNYSGDGIRCATVRLEQGNQTGFRVNVDGAYLGETAGWKTTDVEIRDGDSIRVFVELTAPSNGMDGPQLLSDNLVFTLESGVEQEVVLMAYSWDAEMLSDAHFNTDTIIGGTQPIVVYGGITVDSLATLTIAAGTTIYFNSGAGIDVYGTLVAAGEAGSEVTLRGSRTDYMFDYLPYDRVSGQWEGMRIHESSYNNTLTYTDLHSSFDGIVCDSANVGTPKLALVNSTVHNCQGYGVRATCCHIDMRNTQVTNTLDDCVNIDGGYALLLHCTLAQFYPFDTDRGYALAYTNSAEKPLEAIECVNSIVTGYADDVINGVTSVVDVPFYYYYVSSILRTPEIEDDDERLQDVIWEGTEDTETTDSVSGYNHFKLVDIDLQDYDFHLDSLSPAIGAASTLYSLSTDRDGNERDDAPDIGAYEYIKE